MQGYLGEFDVNIEDTEFANFTPRDWVIEYIENYGQIDGAHHKQWLLDQIVQILSGTPVVLKIAKWDNGESEYRYWLGDPSEEYLEWLDEQGDSYDEGIAP